MSPKYFIEIIRKIVHEQSVNDTIETLESPIGNETSKESIKHSEFYRSLTDENKEILKNILFNTSEMTIFGLLCVLDGVRAIENGAEKGALELWYRKGDYTELLNDPDNEFLHDLFL